MIISRGWGEGKKGIKLQLRRSRDLYFASSWQYYYTLKNLRGDLKLGVLIIILKLNFINLAIIKNKFYVNNATESISDFKVRIK